MSLKVSLGSKSVLQGGSIIRVVKFFFFIRVFQESFECVSKKIEVI